MNPSGDAHTGHATRQVEQSKTHKGVGHVLAGEDESTLWVMGELLTRKIPGRTTGGAYSLFEVASPPGAGSPPHVNHREDEAFYVLEGGYEFLIDEHTLRAEAGFLFYVAKGTLHAHKNIGQGVGKMLLTQTPGGLYERFFEEVGKPADGEAAPPVFEDHSDAAGIRASAAEYGIEIPRPDAR